MKFWNLPKSNALSETGVHWVESYFHFLSSKVKEMIMMMIMVEKPMIISRCNMNKSAFLSVWKWCSGSRHTALWRLGWTSAEDIVEIRPLVPFFTFKTQCVYCEVRVFFSVVQVKYMPSECYEPLIYRVQIWTTWVTCTVSSQFCLRVMLQSANCFNHYFVIRLDKMIDYKCLLYMSTWFIVDQRNVKTEMTCHWRFNQAVLIVK